MKHPRQIIREAVLAKLFNETPAGENVFVNRVVPIWESQELPAVQIYTPAEQSEIYNQSPRIYKNTLELRIEIAVQQNEKIDDTLDNFALIIERLILEDDTISGSCASVVPVSASLNIAGEGKRLVGVLAMWFEVVYTYRMPDGVTTDGLYELITIHNQYSLSGTQGEAEQAQSTLTGLDR